MTLSELGKTFPGLTGKNKEHFGKGAPFVTYMNVYANTQINAAEYGYVDVESTENQNSLEYGDILFTISSETPNEVGMASVFLEKPKNKVYLNSFCFGFRLYKQEHFSPQFAKYYFRTNQFRKKMTLIAQGSTRFNLSKKLFLTTSVEIPSINEQNKIISILNTWDHAIQKLTEKIEKKKSIQKDLYQRLLSGKKRLNGFSDKWKKIPLHEVCKITMGQSPKSSEYNEEKRGLPLIQGNNDIKNRKTVARIWTTEITKTAKQGDIIMTVRAPVGLVATAVDNLCIGRGVCAIQATAVDKTFLLKFLESLENGWKRFEQGSTFTAVNSTDIKNLLISIPSSESEQAAIANIFTSAEEEIKLLQQKLKLLKEQKQYLLNNLITGKIRTPENLSITHTT